MLRDRKGAERASGRPEALPGCARLCGGLSSADRAFGRREGTRVFVAGISLNLQKVAADHLRVLALDSPREEGLIISLRTPRNEPVLPTYAEGGEESPPLAIRNLDTPLDGFRLQVNRENPAAEKSRISSNRMKLGLYLAGLGFMAGTGAFLLVRMVRRELELASKIQRSLLPA